MNTDQKVNNFKIRVNQAVQYGIIYAGQKKELQREVLQKLKAGITFGQGRIIAQIFNETMNTINRLSVPSPKTQNE